MLRVALVVAVGCSGSGGTVVNRSSATVPTDGPAFLAGTWTASTESYGAAGTSRIAIRFTADGTFQNGTWSGTFRPVAPRSPGAVSRFELDRAGRTIRFLHDGAEESARYTLEAPDRWKTETTDGEAVTVYYVRR